MAEQPERQEFIDRDLIGAVFWCVDLTGAEFEDVNLSEVSISRTRVCNVTIDGLIDKLTVNGVDVTAFVNEHDPWFPLRTMVVPPDPAGMRAAWQALDDRWTSTIADARQLSDQRLHERVNDEWSFVDTLRHLVFCIDKWFFAPVLEQATFHPIGLPNTGSIDFGWPGLELAASPAIDDVVATRAEQGRRLAEYLDELTDDDLDREVTVLENGTVTVGDAVRVVLEEEFEHLRYAIRDLGW